MNEAVHSALFDSPPSSPRPLTGAASSGQDGSSTSTLPSHQDTEPRAEGEVPPPASHNASDVIETEEGGPGIHGNDTDLIVGAESTHNQEQEGGRQQGDPTREETIAVSSSTSEQGVTDTAARVAVPEGRSTRRSTTIQTTLTASLLRPPTLPPSQLPNLALAALQRLAERTADHDDSLDDFRPLKKRKLTNDTTQSSEEEQEGQTCSICFEPWTNSGEHRIASLKCGHLFGLNCIEKWLRDQGGGKCPQCNANAKKGDIRAIFAKTISVVDTTERDRALKELEVEKAQRILAQKAETQALIQYQLAKAECERLRKELRAVREQLEVYTRQGVPPTDPTADPPTSTTFPPSQTLSLTSQPRDDLSRYVPHKTLTVSQAGSARVMAHDPSLGMLVASKPSNNRLLPGYGLMKYSTLELSHGEYVGVHSSAVRDVVFSPRGDGMVLSAGMDKTCRLTSMQSNATVQVYETSSPAWACAWNVDDPNYVYAGLQNGMVHVYDTRNTASHVTCLQPPGGPGGRVPITSLSYVPLCRASSLNVGGLLAGTLNGGIFWERASREESFTPHPLDTLPGRCTCLSFEAATRHCMVSFRPSTRTPQSRHVLCQLCNVPLDQPLSCRPIHQFTGGSVYTTLSRSRLFQRPGNDGRILAAFGDEETNSVQIWNASTISKLQTISLTHGPALDITPFSSGDKDFLAVLSETTMSVYHWQQC